MKTYSERLNAAIPGGAHTYSRGDDQYPQNAPQILERGEGAYVYTPEGEKFLDYGMSLRAVTLGYGEPTVAAAAIKQIHFGNNLTRPSLIELEAAELMCELFPSVDMVKFAKNGSTVTTAALKVARGYTGRKYIARCFDHPFFSFDDWFIGDTPLKRGIPEEHYELTLNFRYNDIASLETLFEKYPDQIAGVI
ncbi:MAG: aminotransferase class III-fold pyridoxal phosphate-dependent enzyme, partial [Rikenellaceae bacterium]